MIKFERVNKVYPNGLHALKNISLEINQGEFVALIECMILAKDH